MGDGLERRCVGRVYGADGAVRQYSAPEDGRNCSPKNVELIEIIDTTVIVASSWLFILYYCVSDARAHKHQT